MKSQVPFVGIGQIEGLPAEAKTPPIVTRNCLGRVKRSTDINILSNDLLFKRGNHREKISGCNLISAVIGFEKINLFQLRVAGGRAGRDWLMPS